MKWFADLQVLWNRRRWRVVIVLAGIAAVVVAGLGGFERAPMAAAGEQAPRSGADQLVSTQVLSLQPRCAWFSDLAPGQAEVARGRNQYLILRLRARSLVDDGLATSYLREDLRWQQDIGRGLKPDRLQRVDGQGEAVLQPDLPVWVDAVWELPAQTPPPAQASWQIYKRRYLERGYLSHDESWVEDGLAARIDLPMDAACAEVSP